MTSRVNEVLLETVEHDDITFVHLVDLARQLEEELAASQFQVAELRRALEWIADQERYTFAECSLAEQIISTAKNVIACKKEEK